MTNENRADMDAKIEKLKEQIKKVG